MAGLTPQDGIFGNKAETESKSPSGGGASAPAPYAHDANPKKYGRQQNATRLKASKFKDGSAEIAVIASLIQMMF